MSFFNGPVLRYPVTAKIGHFLDGYCTYAKNTAQICTDNFFYLRTILMRKGVRITFKGRVQFGMVIINQFTLDQPDLTIQKPDIDLSKFRIYVSGFCMSGLKIPIVVSFSGRHFW
jgi:hypothetical protein